MNRFIARLVLAACLLTLFGSFTIYAQDAAECESGFRLVEHAYGTVCIPEQPQHIASLDITVYETLMLLGQTPAVKTQLLIDAFYTDAHPELVDEINALNADVPDMGFPPNFEVVAEAQPELIIGVADVITEDIYALLSQIAPTFVFEAEPGDWRTRVEQTGITLNLTEQTDALLAVYDARVAEFQALVGDGLAELEVSLVRVFPDQIGIMLTGSIADRVIQDVGLSRPADQVRELDFVQNELAGRAELTISREELRLADGDIILLFGTPDALADDLLWQQLEAVKAGNAYPVGYYWYVDGLISVHDMLDDLFLYVAGTESTIPNPYETAIFPSPEATPEATTAP